MGTTGAQVPAPAAASGRIQISHPQFEREKFSQWLLSAPSHPPPLEGYAFWQPNIRHYRSVIH